MKKTGSFLYKSIFRITTSRCEVMYLEIEKCGYCMLTVHLRYTIAKMCKLEYIYVERYKKLAYKVVRGMVHVYCLMFS